MFPEARCIQRVSAAQHGFFVLSGGCFADHPSPVLTSSREGLRQCLDARCRGDKAPARTSSGVLHDMTASAGYQAPPPVVPRVQTHAPPMRTSSLKWGSPRASEGAARRLTDFAQARPTSASAWEAAAAPGAQTRRLSAASRPSTALPSLPRAGSGGAFAARSESLAGDASHSASSPRLSAPGQRAPITRSMSGIPRAAMLRTARCTLVLKPVAIRPESSCIDGHVGRVCPGRSAARFSGNPWCSRPVMCTGIDVQEPWWRYRALISL